MKYSNSSLVTYTRLAPATNYYGQRNHDIDTITIHCYVGQVTAKQGCDYFATTKRTCTANYVVGKDGSIGLCVEEKNAAATSSNKQNDNRAVTIEVACDKTRPYKITEEARKALIKLCVDICKRNGIKRMLWANDKSLIGQIDKQNVTVHRWFSATECPGEYILNILPDICEEVNTIMGEPDTKYEIVYRVQVGAFSNKQNAEKLLSELKEKGFRGLITTAFREVQ